MSSSQVLQGKSQSPGGGCRLQSTQTIQKLSSSYYFQELSIENKETIQKETTPKVSIKRSRIIELGSDVSRIMVVGAKRIILEKSSNWNATTVKN